MKTEFIMMPLGSVFIASCDVFIEVARLQEKQ